MAQVALDINGRRYEMACDDGEEERLRRVGHFLDQRMRALTRQVGSVGETRLMLMTALMVSDELLDVAEGGGAAEKAAENAETEQAAEAIENMADRLERIAARLEAS